MKARFIYNQTYLRVFRIQAITLYPFVFFQQPKEQVSDRLFRHELEHCYQASELGWFKFYRSYLTHYLRGRLSRLGHRQAYLEIPYEAQARIAEQRPLSFVEKKQKQAKS